MSDFDAGFEEHSAKYKHTTFRYTNLLSDSVLTGNGAVRATVRVTNTGSRPGKEAVLWFMTDEVGCITRPVRLLNHFGNQEFKPGRSRELTFTIHPQQDLSYSNAYGNRLLHAPRGRPKAVLPLRRCHGQNSLNSADLLRESVRLRVLNTVIVRSFSTS